MADAGYLLLHNDEVRTAELWRITSSGPRVLSGANPVVAEGLGAAEPETVYFVYEVEPDTHFEGWEWDVTELVRERPESSLPFALTLERVLAAGHPRA